MKCECKKRMAILTCVACQKILCSYCIQLSDHNCVHSDVKISKEKNILSEKLERYAVKPTKQIRI